MEDIFCLIILESGSRRKLKLQKGTYDELLASLGSLVDVVLDNTLIQIFDTDLEDFVDLLPDDTIENKAKLRIIQKNIPAPKRTSNAAWSNGSVTPSHPLHNEPRQIAPSVQRPVLPWYGRQLAGTSSQKSISGAGPVPCLQPRPRLPEVNSVNESTLVGDAIQIDLTEDSVFGAGPVPCLQPRPPLQEANSANESTLVGDAIKIDLTEDSVLAGNGGTICRIGKVFSQAPPEQHENNGDQRAKSPEQTAYNDDNNGEELECELRQPGTSARSNGANGGKESGDPVIRMSQVWKMLQLLARDRPLNEAAQLAAKPGALPTHHDNRDYLKFTLPSSFGVTCDSALASRAPVTKLIKKQIIDGLFSECVKVTLYPSRKMYVKAIDELVAAHPHLIEGQWDWRAWALALKSKFKNVRKRLPEGVLQVDQWRKKNRRKQKSPEEVSEDSEQSDLTNSRDTSPERKTSSTKALEQYFTRNAAASLNAQAGPSSPAGPSESQDEPPEEVVNGLVSSATPFKEVTVFELLDMCTREPITPKKLFRQSTLEWHDDEEQGGSKSLQISEEKADCMGSPNKSQAKQPQDHSDYLRFELPSLGIYEESLEKKAAPTGRMRRYIINCLFDACCKITMCPSLRLYRAAVDRLLEKYPHLKDPTGKTGREMWTESLKAKFKDVRRRLPGHMRDPDETEGEKPSAKRPKSEETGRPDVGMRVSRPPNMDFPGGNPAERAKSSQSSSDRLPSKVELLAAKDRHDSVQKMTIPQAIKAFPRLKQEPSLLGEFRTLWRRDIAECFEMGIKRMFLVLMNLGTKDEVRAISQADGDILRVVLNATAARCGEKLDALLTENTTLPTPCLVKRADGSMELFVDGYFLFTASSLLGGVCALFAAFWVFHIEYSKNALNILTFLEHAFLNLRQTKPHVRCCELINLYRSSNL